MVQKSVPVLQSDHVKFCKLFKNLKPSSSSFQHQESDMMKIMKKQRQNLYSPTFTKQISQPGKPPTPSMSATSKMQSLIKISEKKPNYMKPTTSSDARKDNSQENSKKNGKITSKSVRALTKTTSFKPTRSATKKSYPFVETVEKPTCSSTLKDSKFPDFLRLNSGGTESEGTSIMKVCTYTYCSLNGHHHHPLPPLKSFLSARRHILKTEMSKKMGSLSPRRSREHRDVIVEENKTLQDQDEFFIQIYTKESEAAADRVEIVQELESASLTDTDTNRPDSPGNLNLNENDAIEYLEPEINTMEGVENQEDEEKSTENNMEDIQGFSPFDSGLYLDDYIPDEIENKYIEEMKVDEVNEESFDEETITCLDANSDRDLQIDETIENSNIQADDETDESDTYQNDEIDNTKIVKIEVDYEDDVLTEDDNQEFKKDSAVDDNYCPSDHISETEDDTQELKEDGTIGDHYAPSEQKSESEIHNHEVQKQSSTEDQYQSSDQKSESDEDNQQLMKDIAIDSQYQQTDQNSVSDSIEILDEMDESIELCSDSQSDLTGNNSLEIKNMHTIALDEDLSKGKWMYKQKESMTEENDLKGFNPRGPNFLELGPDPESEKVDLKHQMIDDRRNSEEWMLDYALQQAVNKLALARKKKVTLLVEAFETVSPLPKWEKPRMGVGFDLQHRIQACR